MDSLKSEVESVIDKKRLCIVCEEKQAMFFVKGIPSTCYCKECAEQQFGDLDLLEKI